jgi:ankyrin repeat protein
MTALTVACGGRDVSKHDAAILKHLSRTSADAEKAMQGLNYLQEVQENVPQRVPVVKALVDAGADVNGTLAGASSPPNTTETSVSTPGTMTPLMCAAELGHSDVARCLLEAGADVTARDSIGGTALIKAAALGRTECIEILINHVKEDASRVKYINCVDKNGVSAVLAAVVAGQADALWTLLVAGADPNIGSRTSDGCTALHIAAASGRGDIVNALVSLNAEVNAVNSQGETPIYIAAELGKVKAVAALVKSQRCTPSLTKADDRGWTPLMAALKNNHIDVVIVLLNSKKDLGVNVADRKDGTTAMAMALALGEPGECVIYRLMVAGADPYALTGRRAPDFLQRGSGSSVEEPVIEIDDDFGDGADGPIPAVKVLAEGVTHGLGVDKVIPEFL